MYADNVSRRRMFLFYIYKYINKQPLFKFKFDSIRKCLIVQSNFTGKHIVFFKNNYPFQCRRRQKIKSTIQSKIMFIMLLLSTKLLKKFV